MIEGTRQFKGGDKKIDTREEASSPSESAMTPQTRAPAESDAVNLERREWFSSLIPALGDGLVKLLRASNNLQHDLHTALKEKTDSFALPADEKEKKDNPGK